MSLNQDTLKNNLLSIFRNMADGDDSYFAKAVSKKVADYAQSGSITTTDAGTVSAGVFAGLGNGSISVDSTVCEKIVYVACSAMSKMSAGGDVYFATQLALGIDSMITAGTVHTTVKGTVTPPSGTPVILAGTAKGTFTGVSATLQGGFLAAFNTMLNMKSGGNEYLAGEMATTITAYLKAGVIATQGQVALLGSLGTGSMS